MQHLLAPVVPPDGEKTLRSCTPNVFTDVWDWIHNIHDVGSAEQLFDEFIHQTFSEPGHRVANVDEAFSDGYFHAALRTLQVALEKWALQKSEAQLWKPSRVKETKPQARQQQVGSVVRAAQRKLKVFTLDLLRFEVKVMLDMHAAGQQPAALPTLLLNAWAKLRTHHVLVMHELAVAVRECSGVWVH